MAEIHPEVIPKQAAEPFSLKTVALINLKLAEPEAILTNTDRNHSASLVRVIGGEITTVPNDLGLKLELNGITGFDDLTASLVTGNTVLDCKLYGKTANGSGVYITYDGLLKLSPKTIKVLSRQDSKSEFSDSFVSCFPKFRFDDGIEDEFKWISAEVFVGRGRFIRDNEGSLYIQYFISVYR